MRCTPSRKSPGGSSSMVSSAGNGGHAAGDARSASSRSSNGSKPASATSQVHSCQWSTMIAAGQRTASANGSVELGGNFNRGSISAASS